MVVKKKGKVVKCRFCGGGIVDGDFVRLVTVRGGRSVSEFLYHFSGERNCWLDFFNGKVEEKVGRLKDGVLSGVKDIVSSVGGAGLLKGLISVLDGKGKKEKE